MKSLLRIWGKMVFIFGWPVLFVLLRWSHRTRVLIVCGDEVLCVKGWLGNEKWSLPGGGIHKGEDPINSAVREIQEEVGLVLQPRELRIIGDAVHRYRGLTYHYYQIICQLKTKPAIKRNSLEIIDVAWLPITKLNAQEAEPVTLAVHAAWSKAGGRGTL